MTPLNRAARLLSGISLAAFAVAAPAAARTAAGTSQDPPAEQTDAAEGQASDPIIVTGTRRTDRTLADSPVPIDVIGEEPS